MDESVRHSNDKRVQKDPFRLPRSDTLENLLLELSKMTGRRKQ
jgi:hypothetical protein